MTDPYIQINGPKIEFFDNELTAVRTLKQLSDGTYITGGITPISGWIPAGTFTYASASTITVASGAASIFQIGDKIRFYQAGGWKNMYITLVADTLLTVNGAGLYAVTASEITGANYSHSATPLGFPINMIPGYVKCSVCLGTTQSDITDATYTKVLLATESFDISSSFATYKFVAPVTGYYRISGAVVFGGVIVDKDYLTAIYKNNTNIIFKRISASIAANHIADISCLVLLDASDYIELFAAAECGANTTDIVADGINTHLDVELVSII